MLQSSWDNVADKIWTEVNRRNPEQLEHRLQSFQPCPDIFTTDTTPQLSEDELVRKAKDEIIETLSGSDDRMREWKSNFLLRLISDNENAYIHYSHDEQTQHVPKIQLALAFLWEMIQNSGM